jgi:hypothetical protein
VLRSGLSGLVEEARQTAGEEIDREAHAGILADIRAAIARLDTVGSRTRRRSTPSPGRAPQFNEITETVARGLRQLDALMAA